MAINPALIGKAGEMLVGAELMRRGVEVAYPASDVGIDLLAYRLVGKQTVPAGLVPIQVKARSNLGYYFFRNWFERVPGVILVHVWKVASTPQFYIFQSLAEVELALGDHAKSESWTVHGNYSVTKPKSHHIDLMEPHRDRWNRIVNHLPLATDGHRHANPA